MLDNKVVVITGGAGFLGRAFASAVAANGGTAIIADLDLAAGEQVATEINSRHPGHCDAATLDITNRESVVALLAQLSERYGRIDALVNNAYPRNRNYGRRLEEVTYADFCENVSSHLDGYFLVAKEFCLFFRGRGGGNIVNMSSIYGVMAPRFEIYDGTTMTMPVEYAAIKSAVIHLTRYFAKYFRQDRIRVNCLSPGGILDRQPEQFLRQYNRNAGPKGMLDPMDLCGTLVFLLSDASLHVNGQNLVVDDSFSL